MLMTTATATGDQVASDGHVFNKGVTVSGMVPGPLAVEDEVFDHN